MVSFKVFSILKLFSWWHDPHLLERHHSRPIWSILLSKNRLLSRTEFTAYQFNADLIIHKKHQRWNSTIKSIFPVSIKVMEESKTVQYWKIGNHNIPLKLSSNNSKKKWLPIKNSHNLLKEPLIEINYHQLRLSISDLSQLFVNQFIVIIQDINLSKEFYCKF